MHIVIILIISLLSSIMPLNAQTFSLSHAHVTFQGKHGLGYFGFSTVCGNFNGDRYTDVVVGAYNASRQDFISVGEVYLFRGRGTLIGTIQSGYADGIFQGKSPFDEAGFALAAGDVNGDGFSDLIIGAPGANDSAGEVYVILGNPALLGTRNLATASMTLMGEDADDRAGTALAVGDVNLDGYSDIIIGAPGADEGSGSVYVIFGMSIYAGTKNLASADVSFFGSNQYDEAGSALSVGDINGDGITDLCIGAPMANEAAGAVYIIYGKRTIGRNNNLSGADVTLVGKNAGDQAGVSLACGDINGDKFRDIVVGAPLASPGGVTSAGEVYVVFGGRNLPLRQILAFADFSLEGVDEYDQAGISVATANLNHDRYQDIIIGANLAKRDDREVGEVYFYRGRRGLHGNYSLIFSWLRFQGKENNSEAGFSVSAGDFNSDGFEDVVIGSWKVAVDDLPEVGEAYIIYSLGL